MANLAQGQRYFDTTLNLEIIYDGVIWRDGTGRGEVMRKGGTLPRALAGGVYLVDELLRFPAQVAFGWRWCDGSGA